MIAGCGSYRWARPSSPAWRGSPPVVIAITHYVGDWIGDAFR